MRAPPLLASLVSIAIASAVVLSGRVSRSEPDAGGGGGGSGAAGRSPELEAAVRSLVNDRLLKDALVSVVVMDCETGAVLAQSGEHVLVNPASNAKLYTAAAALAILHGSHRYQTTLSGTIKANAGSGLVLRGHGDPSLHTEDLWAMVQEAKAHGMKRVEGDLVVDQRFFDEQTTPPAFEQ